METTDRYLEWLEGVRHCVYSKKTVTQVRLSAITGTDKVHLNAVLRGRDKRAGNSLQDALSKALGMSYDDLRALGQWILDGKDPEDWQPPRGVVAANRAVLFDQTVAQPFTTAMSKVSIALPTGIAKEESNVSPGPPTLRKIPVISFIQAGDWHGGEEFTPEESIACPLNVGPRAFSLRIQGRSMEPEFIAGDYIIVDPDKAVESGDYVVAKNGDEEATFKRYYKDGDRHFLMPLNEDWGKPMDMTGRKWRIVGRVMGKMKEY